MSERFYRDFCESPDFGKAYGKVLPWIRKHAGTAVFLNSNGYGQDQYSGLPWAFAIGEADLFAGPFQDTFEELKEFADSRQDWLFGFFSYELKNQLENLHSKNPDQVGMPPAHFFVRWLWCCPDRKAVAVSVAFPGSANYLIRNMCIVA